MRIKKWLVMTLSGILIFAALPVNLISAEGTGKEAISSDDEQGKYSTKDEVIYGNLDTNGNTKDMYVVNTFHVTKSGKIIDYGDYTDVRNLTNLSDIEQSNGKIQFQTEDKEFYYQGELDNQPLPWDISITYLLDGKEVNAEDLPGQSGDFEIQIETTENKDVDPVFFENYLLQISLTLDPEIFTDIQAPEGTEANEGKNKQISFMVLPDQEEELILTANVTDLEMDPIDISAVPANIAIDDPDLGNMTGDMESLTDAIDEINNGVADLSDGVSELNTGARELSDGSSEYRSGINELDQSSGELVNGSEEIREVLEQVSGAMQGDSDMPDMGDMNELPKGLRDMADGLRESGGGLDELKEAYDEAYGALDGAIDGIPNLSAEEVQAIAIELHQSDLHKSTIDKTIATYEAALIVQKTYNKVKKAFKAVPDTLEQVSTPLHEMATHLETMADGLENGMENLDELDALAELQDGLTTLSSEYETFHNGLVDYTDGVSTLATNYQDLDSGINELSEGTSSLDSGVNELHDGTEELHEETDDMPDEIQDKIDELMEDYENSDFEPASFVSDQNEDIDVVQFVLQTESIEIEEAETTNDEQDEEDKSIWDRFLDLFR